MSAGKCFFILIIFTNNLFAQQSPNDVESMETSSAPIPAKTNAAIDLISKLPLEKMNYATEEKILDNYNFLNFQNRKNEKYTFNFISSFGDNIRFGGFWERYAVVNFTPQMFIQPAEFLSVYANYNLSSFIPVADIKEHFKSFTLQSLTVLAIDNSINLLFQKQHWMPKLIGFAVKNLVINLFIKPEIKNSNRQSIPWIQDESYYYSVRVRF